MAKLIWAVLSQTAVVDRFSNALSVFNIVEELSVPAPPPPSDGKPQLAVLPLVAVTYWRRSDPTKPESVQVRLRIVGPTKKPLMEALQTADMTDHLRTRALATLPGIPVAGAGNYAIIISTKAGAQWKKAGQVDFHLSYESPHAKETVSKKGRRRKLH